MRVIFMGTPQFALPVLERLAAAHRVVAVYTRPDKTAGRGLVLSCSVVKQWALAHQLPVVQPASLKNPDAAARLAEYQPDVIVVAAYGQLLPPSVLLIPRYGCLNVHPSLLPKFRGASPVAAAILAGERFSGASIMLMNEGLDTGPVLVQAQIPISPRDTTGSLTDKLALVAAPLLVDILPRWVKGEITPRPQDEAGASYSRPILKEAGLIDWSLPAVDIWRRVRAFQPWPGCFTRWQGHQLKIIEAVPLPGGDGLRPGEAVALPSGAAAAFGVVTGAGILGIVRVQLEGRREAGSADFLRGQRQLIGAILGDQST